MTSRLRSSTSGLAAPRPPMIVFIPSLWRADLRPPEQMLAGLAQRLEVIVIEEPVFFPGRPTLFSTSPAPGIELLTPRTPELSPASDEHQRPWLAALLDDLMSARHIREPLAWLYSSRAVPLLELLEPRAVVYACAERFVPPAMPQRELLAREAPLLELADLVIADDPALFEACRTRRPDAHLVEVPPAPEQVARRKIAAASPIASGTAALPREQDKPGWNKACEHVMRLLAPFVDAPAARAVSHRLATPRGRAPSERKRTSKA